MNELLTDNSTVNIKRIYGKQRNYAGFSKRFNELLDHCQFIGGRKRSRAVIEYFGKSRSVLYRCLKEDHCPKDIVNMVDKLYNDQLISKNVEQKKVMFWLITGEHNPFLNQNDFIVDQAHSEFMQRIISLINNTAMENHINMTLTTPDDFRDLYLDILQNMKDRKGTTPSKSLIKKLISK